MSKKVDSNKMNHLDNSLKKSKSLNLLEILLGLLGFIFIAIFFMTCLFYIDYKAVTESIRYHGLKWLNSVNPSSSSLPTNSAESTAAVMGLSTRLPEFPDESNEGCDIFDGNWTWDDNYPHYKSTDCPFIDHGFRCLENGRPDDFYTKWRWQPKNCNLPRFDAKKMLEKLRNRRLVLVGDSIGRNQWESLLCMLASGVPNKDSIYEVNGNPITKHKGFLLFMFKDYNCTIEYYRAPYLVVRGRAPATAPPGVRMTLKVDKLVRTSKLWRDADVLLFSSGHWWNDGKTIRQGCYFQEGEEVKMNMSVHTAFRRAIETLVDWIVSEVNMTKTQVFFRTYAPSHFRGGTWKTGGKCHLQRLPEFGSSADSLGVSFNIVSDVLSNRSNNYLNLLNVTRMTARRTDGHISWYKYNKNANVPLPVGEDCSHWCLPGVPDSWNELLYALFLKRELLLHV